MCPDKSLLSAYCDGEVPAKHALAIKKHAELCAACALYLAKVKQMQSVLHAPLAGPQHADESWRDICRAVRRNQTIKAPVHTGRPWLAAVAALAVILGGLAGYGAVKGGRQTEGRRLELAEKAKENAAEQENIEENLLALPSESFGVYGTPGFVQQANFRGK